jgi:hypothetical protein
MKSWPWQRIFWLVLLAVYTVVFWVNYVGRYVPTQDPDPDGYVWHARQLQQTGHIPSHHRLPGYPAFIALADALSPADIAVDVFWVQGALGWVFGGVVLWMLSLMRSPGVSGSGKLDFGQALGMGTGIGWTVLHGCGLFWGLFTATMMSNFIGSLLAGALAWGLWGLWEHSRKPWVRGLGLAGVLLGIFGSVVVHPVNYMILGLLVPAVLGSWLILAAWEKLRGMPWAELRARFLPAGRWIWRGSLLAAVFLAAFVSRKLSYVFFDRPSPDPAMGMFGSSKSFSEEWLSHQMLLRLPAADPNDPVEREIEAMKDRMSEARGWRIERVSMPPFYHDYLTERSRIATEYGVSFGDSHRWKKRLLANPGAAAHAMAEELLHKYHVLLRQSLPAKGYWDVYPDNNTNPFPPDDGGSLRRRLFWDYGIDLTKMRNITDTTKEKKVWQKAWQEIRVIALAALLPLVGLALALRFTRVPGVFLVLWLWMLGYLAALAFCGWVNGRYFLPFFPYLNLLQCLAAAGVVIGIPWLVVNALYHFAWKTGRGDGPRRPESC